MTPEQAKKASARGAIRQQQRIAKKLSDESKAHGTLMNKLAKEAKKKCPEMEKLIRSATRCGDSSASKTFHDENEARAMARVAYEKGWRTSIEFSDGHHEGPDYWYLIIKWE